MKLHYFDRPGPDSDDRDLADAKWLGSVPPGCLLGGRIVWKHLKLRMDPCSSCNGPRARCAGREKSDTPRSSSDIRQIFEDYRSKL